MVLLESIEIPLGTKMPDFELKDPHGKIFKGDPSLCRKRFTGGFTCNHCPYANAVWPRLIKLARYARDLE